VFQRRSAEDCDNNAIVRRVQRNIIQWYLQWTEVCSVMKNVQLFVRMMDSGLSVIEKKNTGKLDELLYTLYISMKFLIIFFRIIVSLPTFDTPCQTFEQILYCRNDFVPPSLKLQYLRGFLYSKEVVSHVMAMLNSIPKCNKSTVI
jgi:hypothetical protein